MSGFESPLGSKKFTVPNLKEIEIPDESGFHQEDSVNPLFRRRASLPALNEQSIQQLQSKITASEQDPAEIEKEFKEARRAKLTGQERLNEGAKKRLEMLLNMTRTTHSIDIEGNPFVFQTIPSKSMREAIMSISAYDGTVEFSFEVRRQFLSRSLTHIAGVEFEQFVGSHSLEAKLSFIDALDEPLLNRLYDEYLAMGENARKKYAIKNEQDVKDIVEDLKK